MTKTFSYIFSLNLDCIDSVPQLGDFVLLDDIRNKCIEVRNWCDNNLNKENYFFILNYKQQIFGFLDKEDAIFFKMIWGNCVTGIFL